MAIIAQGLPHTTNLPCPLHQTQIQRLRGQIKINVFSQTPITSKPLHLKCSVFNRDRQSRFYARVLAEDTSDGCSSAVSLDALPPRKDAAVVVPKRNAIFQAVSWLQNMLTGRNWNPVDLARARLMVTFHFLCVFAPFTFSWPAYWLATGLYFVTSMLGITLCFHRNLSHKSFKLPKWLEYTFAYCGVQAMQGDPIEWVSTHRFHHQFVDSERDPHSPIEGFWFSHINWVFDSSKVAQKTGGASNVEDLQKQPFYRFIQSTYFLHPVALGTLLYALGGFPFVVWGMAVRLIFVFHATFLVNSAAHLWGSQQWNTGDQSRNNWWVAVMTFGEGWHNNHHAFESSARHGLEWWQLDLTWYVVRLLQALGLATHVKLPSEAQKRRLAFVSVVDSTPSRDGTGEGPRAPSKGMP